MLAARGKNVNVTRRQTEPWVRQPLLEWSGGYCLRDEQVESSWTAGRPRGGQQCPAAFMETKKRRCVKGGQWQAVGLDALKSLWKTIRWVGGGSGQGLRFSACPCRGVARGASPVVGMQLPTPLRPWREPLPHGVEGARGLVDGGSQTSNLPSRFVRTLGRSNGCLLAGWLSMCPVGVEQRSGTVGQVPMVRGAIHEAPRREPPSKVNRGLVDARLYIRNGVMSAVRECSNDMAAGATSECEWPTWQQLKAHLSQFQPRCCN